MVFNEFPWVSYDRKFGQLKAQTEDLPWGSIHVETYLFGSMSKQTHPACLLLTQMNTLHLEIVRERGNSFQGCLGK